MQHFSIGRNVRTWIIDFEAQELWTFSDAHLETGSEFVRNLDCEKIDDFLRDAETLGFLDWQGDYIHPDILNGTLFDGHQWRIDLVLADGTERRIFGNNAYPETWSGMGTAFKALTGEHIV